MAGRERVSILRWIRRLSAEAGGGSDAQLLNRFAADRDEAAFELLLWRHARLVYGVCLRVLHDEQDAEDAFQATFLALARHAGRIVRRESIAGWLHQVAYRVALTARSRRARRYARENCIAAPEPFSSSTDTPARLENQELRTILDQEIGRLPDRFRAVVVLHYLEGKTVDEAAMLLGCPRGTVASRLARARQRLRLRLAGRGFGDSAGLETLAQANAPPRPLTRIPTLTAAALRYTAKGAAAGNILTPRITTLTQEALRAMFFHKLKTGIFTLTAFVGIVLGGGGLAIGLQRKAGPETDAAGVPAVSNPPAPQKEKEAAGNVPAKMAPTVTVCLPTRRQSAPYQDYNGRLEARQAVDIYPAVGGFVVKVCVKAGTEVKKGDLLFELDPRAALAARQKAEVELALAEAKKKQSDDAMRALSSLPPGQNVVNPQLAKLADQAPTAEAAVKTARLELDRARLDFDATKVPSPMDGQVGRILVSPGSLVFRGPDRATRLTTVSRLDPLGLTFAMDERTFLSLRSLPEKEVKGLGNKLQVRLAGEDGFPREARLDGFADRADPTTGTVTVHGTLPNPRRLLLPGMFATVRMVVGPPRAVLEVPESAIASLGPGTGGSGVFVVGKDNIAKLRQVTLGWLDSGMRVVESGLAADDWVVISPAADRCPDGKRVEPRKITPKETH